MFNIGANQNKKSKTEGIGNSTSAVTILTSGCHFSGKMYCRGSSRIAGRIEGEIISDGLLIIEEEALVTAEITAEDAIVQGEVKGRLKAKGRVELCASSKFEGDIITPALAISEGALFNGRATMSISEEAEKDKNPTIDQVKKDDKKRKFSSKDRKQPEVIIDKSDTDTQIYPEVAASAKSSSAEITVS